VALPDPPRRRQDAQMNAPINAAASADIDGRYAWLRLVVSVALSAVGGVGTWAVIVVLPAVQAEFGTDRGQASLAYTATMLGFAAGNALGGRAIDRFGFVRPALGAALMLGAGFLLAAHARSIEQFTLVQGLLIGIGSAATFGPLIADISHWFVRRRGIAVAIAAAGNYLAGAVWPATMPPFILSYGWRSTYIMIGLFCLASMIPMVLCLRRRLALAAETSVAAHRARKVSLNIAPGRLQLLLVAAGIGCCTAMSMPQVHLVAYCMDLGYGVARGAEMLSLMLAAGIVSRVASGFVADRIGGIATALIGSMLQCISLLLYLPFDGLASLYIVSFVFGLSQGGIVPCYAIIVRETMPAVEAGRRVGIVIMATVIGMALGGWLSGWIYDLTGSYQLAFLNGIAFNLVNMSILSFLYWRARPALPVAGGAAAAG